MILVKGFQRRLVFFILGLVSVVQIIVFLTVDITNTRHAKEQIVIALDVGVRTFRRVVDARTAQLSESVRILAGDFAFKAAIATGDVPTIESVLSNHGSRVGAEAMMLIDLEHRVIAQTDVEIVGALPEPLRALLRRAENEGRASGAITLTGKPYQLLVVPVLAPLPIAWIITGFAIDDRLANELSQFTRLDVSVLASGNRLAPVIASSLPAEQRSALGSVLAGNIPAQSAISAFDLAGDDYVSRVVPFADEMLVMLHKSLSRELAPFQRLRMAVLFLSFGGLLLSVFGAFFVARTVTRPVLTLAQAAREVERGNYETQVELKQNDELGELAGAFNRMMRGLAERDRVRSLLGKVVSPEIAEKLLSREVELGGEERRVTVLFSDLRGFTALSEKRSAHDTVTLLNTYFTRMSAAIEAHQGVVDKYLGDGIMALFGAPVSQEDDAGNAIRAALAMQAELDQLNQDFVASGMPPLTMGIGINTGTVVAGNLGSPERLNYTVIGDSVNLAARLEGLTKRLAADERIVISADTLAQSKRRFTVRDLGPMEVRGKSEPVTVYAVLGEESPPA